MTAQSQLTAFEVSVFYKKRGLPWEYLFIAYMKCLTTFDDRVCEIGLYFCCSADYSCAYVLHP